MSKTPSPCISVCKFKREGHCIGCSMTKAQKSMFKTLRKETHRQAIVDMLVGQQQYLGKHTHWIRRYLRKCQKKKARPAPRVRDMA